MQIPGATITDGYRKQVNHGMAEEELTTLKSIAEWQTKPLAGLFRGPKSAGEDGATLLDCTEEGRLPKPVASDTLVLWGSIGSEAVVEVDDAGGHVVDRASRDRVPARTGPERPIPSFEPTVKASAIAYVRFSGAPPGGYLVCDEVRFTPPADAAK